MIDKGPGHVKESFCPGMKHNTEAGALCPFLGMYPGNGRRWGLGVALTSPSRSGKSIMRSNIFNLTPIEGIIIYMV